MSSILLQDLRIMQRVLLYCGPPPTILPAHLHKTYNKKPAPGRLYKLLNIWWLRVGLNHCTGIMCATTVTSGPHNKVSQLTIHFKFDLMVGRAGFEPSISGFKRDSIPVNHNLIQLLTAALVARLAPQCRTVHH